MKLSLTLKYSPEERVDADAWLLLSTAVDQLFAEITALEIDAEKILLYPICGSPQDGKVRAWFIPEAGNKKPSKAIPCVHRGGGLYSSANSTLYPQVSPEELAGLNDWEISVFTPDLGLSGFDKTEALKLQELIDVEWQQSKWQTPQVGIPTPLKLEFIELSETFNTEELMDKMKDDIGSKDIKEIPDDPNAKKGALDGLSEKLGFGGLKGKNPLKQAGGLISAGGLKGFMWAASKVPGTAKEPTWINRLEEWAGKKLNNLLQEREKSLDRLLNMLKNDPSKGLEYALPIDGDEAARGVAAPSSSLFRNKTTFSFGGGGGPADYWDIGDNYYWQLQAEYRRLAKEETEKGNFQRAAYIYASLLADFEAAADVLKQGRFYHEAAVIYKDKLKSPIQAAECYVDGGLLNEAIKIYIEEKFHEKAGDLYRQLEQHEKAREFYQKGVNTYISQDNIIDAAVILEEKMDSTEEALKVLENAWPDHTAAKVAKKKRFQILSQHQRHEDAAQDLQRLLINKNTDTNLMTLEVLVHTAATFENSQIKAQAAEVSTVITADCLETMNLSSRGEALNLYQSLQNHDPLFMRDCNRLINQLALLESHQKSTIRTHNKKGNVAYKQTIKLDEEITWLQFLTVGEEFVLAGVGKDKMQVCRINESLQTSKLNWPGKAGDLYGHHIFQFNLISGGLDLSLYGQKPFPVKSFPKAKNFTHLAVGTPPHISEDTIAIAPTASVYYSLRYTNNQFVIATSKDSSLNGTTFLKLGDFLNVKKILCSDKELFFAGDDEVCIQPFKGKMRHLKFNEPVYDIVLSPQRTRKRLFVSLEKGVVIVWPENDKRAHIAQMLTKPEVFLLRNGIICMINRESGQGWLYRTKGVSEVTCLDRIKVEPEFLQMQQGRSPDELAILYAGKIITYQVNS